MMSRDDGVRKLPDGLGYLLEVHGGEPLPVLTTALTTLCELVSADPGRVVVVLRLSARADADRAWPGNVNVQDVTRWERAVRRLGRCPAAVIAELPGTCAGPALDLTLAADYRVCAPATRLLLPINDGHFWPGMAVHALVRQVGYARARQIVMWGEDLSAEQATAIGLFDRISADTEDAVRQATVLFGRISDAELAVRRQLLSEAVSSEFDEAIGAHLAACDRELRRLSGTGSTHVAGNR
ncbi:enoyl-CoA-hydratase DpgB [Streptomyces anulatus]|uniref:enoyl-CoA-hydratase DpgB n=1 Tax=Streptomyces anulatus TaxID=1892 RepID=UPI00342CF2B3